MPDRTARPALPANRADGADDPTRHLDLNLLRVLVEIHDAGGVSAACKRLHLSQPAVSNALARLRDSLDDALFIRTPRGFEPTAFTSGVMPAVRDALARIGQAFERTPRFDPAQSDRWFRIAMTDAGESVFVQPIARELARHGAGLRLQLLSLTFDSLAPVMAAGRIDAAIGPLPADPAGELSVTPLFVEQYHGLVSRNGQLAQRAGVRRRLSRNAIEQARLVVVDQATTLHRRVDQAIEREGLSARVVARAPHFVAVPALVDAFDALAIVPSEIAQNLARSHPVIPVTLALPLTRYEVSLACHRRFERDPANQWLRARVLAALARPASAGSTVR